MREVDTNKQIKLDNFTVSGNATLDEIMDIIECKFSPKALLREIIKDSSAAYTFNKSLELEIGHNRYTIDLNDKKITRG